MTRQTTYINLLGGPGLGKSTIAAEVFAGLKWQGVLCELVTEFAKGIVWDGHADILHDQLFVFTNQHRMMKRLDGKVDFVITDSPLLLSLVYNDDPISSATSQVYLDYIAQFKNLYYCIERRKQYSPVGRLQGYYEAIEIDQKVASLIKNLNVSARIIPGSPEGSQEIIKDVLNLNAKRRPGNEDD